MAVNDKTVGAFYAAPKVAGASEFALGMTGLGITNVKAVGHKFRQILGDPAAKQVDKERGGEAADVATIPERIVSTPNFLPAFFLEMGTLRARCVCKIDTDGVDFQGTRGNWFGTGFLVAPDILLTNHHVINSIDVARSAWCIFNFQVGVDNRPLEAVAVRLEPERLFLTSPLGGGLDYTFVAIDASAGRQFGFIPMVRSAFTVHPGDSANIIQHPEGGHKKITLQENEVLQDTGVVLHYASDTLGGSSGSPVFNNRWELIALHHASKKNDNRIPLGSDGSVPDFLNEGIKVSAIASDLESRIETGRSTGVARTVLRSFDGVDTLMGYFGALGRHSTSADTAVERVVDTYSLEGQDCDVGFWNVEWFTPCYAEKADALAEVVVDLNFDAWVLNEASANSVRALIERLRQDYDLDFDCALSDRQAGDDAVQTVLIWNMATTVVERRSWPDEVEQWFCVDSQQFDALRTQAVFGRVFDRYPGLFNVRAANRSGSADPFEFWVVPLQLRPTRERSMRTRMAAKILMAAVRRTNATGVPHDWLFGGDYAADIATLEFGALTPDGLATLSAAESEGGAMTYLKSPTSLIDNIFLSPNLSLTFGADDFFITAERGIPEYLRRLSQRSPMLVRLSLADTLPKAESLPASLAEALGLNAR
jgi:Trypsin-like peptidase domain